MIVPLLAVLLAIDPGWTVGTVEQPEDVVLEVGGMTSLEDGSIMVCTRRGETWVIEQAFGEEPVYTLYADGLQEPLGLLEADGWIYTAQRGELSRMRDVDGDNRIDELETVCDDWEISGNYHEYAFGPRVDAEGNFWVTLNKPFGNEPFGKAHWRGWAVRISPEGTMEGACSGGLQQKDAHARPPARFCKKGDNQRKQGDHFAQHQKGFHHRESRDPEAPPHTPLQVLYYVEAF